MRGYARYSLSKRCGWKDNKRFIVIIRNVAERKGYVQCGNVCYRKFYHGCFKPRLEKVLIENNAYDLETKSLMFNGQRTWISYNQFKTLLKCKNCIPILSSVYLSVAFDMLLELLDEDIKKELALHKKDDMPYTSFCLMQYERIHNYFQNGQQHVFNPMYYILREVWDTFQLLDEYCSSEGWDDITQ